MEPFNKVWPELKRVEGNKNDEHESFGIERRWHGVDFNSWPLTEEEAYNWYKDRVWYELGLNELPGELAIDAFLFALNTSLVRAEHRDAPITSPKLARALQSALNAVGHELMIDGKIGPITRRAINRTPHKEALTISFRSACYMYYSGLGGFQKYAASWMRRLEVVAG